MLDKYKDHLRLNEPLSRYTVARLGGPADALITVDSAAMLGEILRIVWENAWPMRIFGGGANVLISDAGFRGLVIINDAKATKLNPDGTIWAESGAALTQIARQAIQHGLSGFEWAISIPGTVGGGVVNNAGAHGGDMAGNLVSAEILFKHGVETWEASRLDYRYRESALKHRSEAFAVLAATLKFDPGHDPAALQVRADGYIAHRKQTQPPGASLGSMFKNPPQDFAGRLIEAAGLKGTRVGGVMISPVHANFFINTGGGTASDYLQLIQLAQKSVQEKFGVALELEVQLIGFEG